MQLTTRSLILLSVTALFLAAATWAAWFLWIALIWLVGVGALLLADWSLSPAPKDWQLQRRHDDRLSLAVWNPITVDVQLQRSARIRSGPLQVWLRDDPPSTFGIADEARILAGTVTPGEITILRYSLYPPRRGDYAFGDLHLRWQSVLGLLRRQATIPASEPVKVYPNLVDVKKFDLLLRKNKLSDMGVRRVRQRGAGTEFERLREYQPDDEYRRINWKATARRGVPITMEYETERSQNIIALLDVGRLMRSPVGDVAKMDYAINAVLLLAYVAGQKGDRIGVMTFADEVEQWLAPRTGKAQFHRMLELLYKVQGQPVESDYSRAFAYLAARQNRRSLLLVFTDLTGSVLNETLVAQMLRLRRTHLPLLVTMRDPTVEALARRPVEDTIALYRRTVAETLLAERELVLEQLRNGGVLTLDVPADELSLSLINRYLEIKAREMI
ncbi:DUF58 domain-containing protein [bacterium]|nr:DUF58 domain-containing protein [bacterium]